MGTLNGSGVATFITASLSGGGHTMTATYSGDSNFSSSTSTAFTQTVTNLTASATALLSSLNPATSGQSVTFTATVSSYGSLTTTPTGSVTFYDSTASLGMMALNGSGVATLATSSLSVASHTITATYGGDTNYSPSSSGPVVEVIDAVSAAMPTFSPVAGTYTSPQLVTISSTTAGAAIYYTTDGSTPTTASFLYTVPVAVTRCV